MDVLITDGDQRASLAVTRSLGSKGIAVVVGESRTRSLAASSRFSSGEFVYPSPWAYPRDFQKSIIRHIRSSSYRLLIPMTDVTCILVSEVRSALENHIDVALPERDLLERAMDKRALLKLATSLGVPVPQTYPIEDEYEMEKICNELPYPVVIKPTKSRMLTSGGWVKGSVDYAYSPSELVTKFKNMTAQIGAPLIQERIPGPGVGLNALCRNGQVFACFAHRRIREKPPSGGVSVLRESVALDAVLKSHAERLLAALGWTGVVMVEFKLDLRDGKPKLMEVNGRFWGSLQLAIDAGVDFPFLLYSLLLEKKAPSSATYRAGVQSRWFLGDLDHLLIIWLHRRGHLSLPCDYPGRLRNLYDFIKSTFQKDCRSEIWRHYDMKPALAELKEYLRSSVWGVFGK